MTFLESAIALILAGVVLLIGFSVINTVMQAMPTQQAIPTMSAWNVTTEPLQNPLPNFTETMKPFFFPGLVVFAILFFLMFFRTGGSDTPDDARTPVTPAQQQQQPQQQHAAETYTNPFADDQQPLPENHYHNRFESILDSEEELEE